MLVVFAATKGGVGKTTLAVHNAVWLYDRGFRVALLDVDDQFLSSDWVRKVEPEITVRQATTARQVVREVDDLLRTHDFVIGDGPQGKDEVTVALLLKADMVVVPLLASGLDLNSTIAVTTELIRAVRRKNRGRPKDVRLVVNGLDNRTRISRHIKATVKKLEIPAAKSMVRRLGAFVDAYIGDTVTVATRMKRQSKARGDINRLFNELLGSHLRKIKPKDKHRFEKYEKPRRAANE